MADWRIYYHKNISLFEAQLLLFDTCRIPNVPIKLWAIILVLTTHIKVSDNLLGCYCKLIYFGKYSSKIPYRNRDCQSSVVLRI